MPKFTTGDVVCLKSEEVSMTVESCTMQDRVQVVWLDADYHVQRESFHVDMLEEVEE